MNIIKLNVRYLTLLSCLVLIRYLEKITIIKVYFIVEDMYAQKGSRPIQHC